MSLIRNDARVLAQQGKHDKPYACRYMQFMMTEAVLFAFVLDSIDVAS
jgi:hypothetical protein